MQKRIKVLLIVVIALVCIIAGTAVALSSGDTIYQGVKVGGVDVGGLTVDEAHNKLSTKVAELESVKVTLVYSKNSQVCTMSDLGASADIESSINTAYQVGRDGNIIERIVEVATLWNRSVDVPVAYVFDEGTAKSFLGTLASKINRAPQDAGITVSGKSISITPERAGVNLDIGKSIDRIASAVTSGSMKVNLVVIVTEPDIKAKQLADINGVLATYSTKYKSWQKDRSFNLGLACKAINGTILKPGEVFSYNKIVGPREAKYGFRDAPMFVKGQVEEGMGGGVCQISSTVYNAALLSNLQIVQRSPHSRPVVYTPVGRDATVAYPYLDLKFRNNTGAPIYIKAFLGKRTVNISILGKISTSQQVEIVSSGHKVIGAPVEETVDGSLEPGKRVVKESGRSGHRITIYRIVKQNGKVLKRELISNNYYKPEKRIVAVPKPVEL
ncbi:MAG: VanW family protein [Armatimonadota bacterium]